MPCTQSGGAFVKFLSLGSRKALLLLRNGGWEVNVLWLHKGWIRKKQNPGVLFLLGLG